MELFIFGLDRPEEIFVSRENPAEACEWKWVRCNAREEVEVLGWKYNYTGKPGFALLPCSMRSSRYFAIP